MTDNFVTCAHCHHDACYENDLENSISWQCLDCGYYTSTLMLKDSDVVESIIATSPSLINDLRYTDEDGRVWFPRVINAPKKGVIFPNGTSDTNWGWTFAPEVLIPEEERSKYPIKDQPGKFQEYKIDMNKSKNYSPMDFILAMEESGLLNYA